MSDSFIDCHSAADAEEHYGDNQAPEVEFLAIPKGCRESAGFRLRLTPRSSNS